MRDDAAAWDTGTRVTRVAFRPVPRLNAGSGARSTALAAGKGLRGCGARTHRLQLLGRDYHCSLVLRSWRRWCCARCRALRCSFGRCRRACRRLGLGQCWCRGVVSTRMSRRCWDLRRRAPDKTLELWRRRGQGLGRRGEGEGERERERGREGEKERRLQHKQWAI